MKQQKTSEDNPWINADVGGDYLQNLIQENVKASAIKCISELPSSAFINGEDSKKSFIKRLSELPPKDAAKLLLKTLF